jgi:hypothetical protein
MSPSRQALSLQQRSLKRLQALVPARCPLVVRVASRGFSVVEVPGERVVVAGKRYEVVASFLDGYVLGWRMRYETYRPDHNGECLNCDEWYDAHLGPALTCPHPPPE